MRRIALLTVLSPLFLGVAGCATNATAPASAPVSAEASQALAPSSEDVALAKRLDAVIDRALAEQRIVGTVVLVARDGKVVYHRAAGLADREASKPMREDTVFRLASMTKPIVSAAALALVEAGTLRLDDPVTRWLPDFQPRLKDGRTPVITVRQLLSHTSGLGYGFFEPADGPYHRADVSDGLDQPGLSFEENARRLASVPLLAEPGTAWIYSLSDDVLGGELARASGSTLQEVVRRTVTGPLGLVDTSFAVPDASRLAVPYADGTPAPVRMGETQVVPFGPSGARFSPGRALDKASYPSGGAGMVGTAGEFLKFLEALRTGGQPVLRHESVTTLTSDQLGALAGPRDGVGFGFGLSVIRDPARAGSPLSKGSWQWGGAYGHSWFVDPAARLSVVALTNTAFEGMSGRFPDEVQRAVYAR